MKNSKKKLGLLLFVTTLIVSCEDSNTKPTANNTSQPSQSNSQPVSNQNTQNPLLNVSTKLKEPAFGGIDSVNGATSPKSGALVPITGDKFEIAGNFVDDVKKDVAAGVIVLIDDKPFVANYGGERPDIAKALNNPKYLKSQFWLTIPTSEIGKGTHKVKIHVIANDLSGYYESAWLGMIDVK